MERLLHMVLPSLIVGRGHHQLARRHLSWMLVILRVGFIGDWLVHPPMVADGAHPVRAHLEVHISPRWRR